MCLFLQVNEVWTIIDRNHVKSFRDSVVSKIFLYLSLSKNYSKTIKKTKTKNLSKKVV